MIDASWALAARGDGSFDRWMLFGATAVQYVTWQTGTILGALGGDMLGDPDALGLDAIYPAFFLALLLGEVRSRRAAGVAILGAAIALALVPVAPAGVPVLAASVAALVGLTRAAQRSVLAEQESEERRVEHDGGAGRRLCARHRRPQGSRTDSARRPRAPALGDERDRPARTRAAGRARLQPGVRGGRAACRGAETAGVVAGGLVAWRTGSIVACVIVAAALTAVLRAL